MNNLYGVLEIALGRASGFRRFTVSARGFWLSMAVALCAAAVPALTLMRLMAVLKVPEERIFIDAVLAAACLMLAPAVIAYSLARRWGRAEQWLNFAIAYQYTRLVQLALYVVVMPLVSSVLMATLGLVVPPRAIGAVIALAVIGYTFWLDWFVLRAGLEISPPRALFGVLAVNVLTSLLVAVPLTLVAELPRDDLFN